MTRVKVSIVTEAMTQAVAKVRTQMTRTRAELVTGVHAMISVRAQAITRRQN